MNLIDFLIHLRDEGPRILRVVNIKPVYRAGDGMCGCFCYFRFKQRLVAQMKRKRMVSRHHLAESSQVVHTVAIADGFIHQQAVVGKVVLVHGLNIMYVIRPAIDGQQVSPHG